ncbi:MAG: YceD family protein [Bacteroidales bacterium]
MSKHDQTYQVTFASLENGQHSFHFQVGKDLFDRFENDELYKPDLNVDVMLDKQINRLKFSIHAAGQAEIQCDRCLEYFTHYFDLDQNIFVRLAEETNFNLNTDYVTLDKDSQSIDMAYFIYEMIVLSLPLKRVHPVDENGNSTCNPEVTKYIDGESEPAPNGEDGTVYGGTEVKMYETETPGNEAWKEELIELLNKNKSKNGTS